MLHTCTLKYLKTINNNNADRQICDKSTNQWSILQTYIKQITQGNTLFSNPRSIIIALLLTTLHKNSQLISNWGASYFASLRKQGVQSSIMIYFPYNLWLILWLLANVCKLLFFFQGGQGPRWTNGAYSGRLGFRPAGKFQIFTRQGVILWSSIVLIAGRLKAVE